VTGQVEELDPTRIRMTVEIPVSQWPAALADVCQEVAEHGAGADWPACRLPFQGIDQRLGTAVLPEAVERAILAAVRSTADAHGVRLMGRPVVEVRRFRPGEPLEFATEVEVRPAVALPDITGLVVTVDSFEVTEDEVDAQIAELRERLATFTQVDRPVRDGDAVQVELELPVGDASVPFGGGDGFIHHVGSRRLPDEFPADVVDLEGLPGHLDTAVAGKVPGDRAVVQIPPADGVDGGAAELTVRVVAVMERQLPAVDDAFAVRAAGRPTVGELRRELRGRLVGAKRTAQLRTACDLVLGEILARTEVPVPAGVVRDEVEHRTRWMVAELKKLGTSLEEHLAERGETAEQIRAAMTATAEERTRGHIVLDTVAEAEDIRATEEEYQAEIVHRAKNVSVSPQTYLDQTTRLGQQFALVGEICRAKAMKLLMQRVTVRDSAGREVDTREGAPGGHPR
jgi:trigger factor